ncbi:hypothetical protein POM88_040209 [Heracleum sosnowskyi]|uniref:Uncharacterized protein n=1 Tax=Heracleum sosnowskyi TaxID=360622 RepID=A0AAD8HE97_9APIA|nr:hypothetical protein POM88_040209 [Heracleum sosnowskyi]
MTSQEHKELYHATLIIFCEIILCFLGEDDQTRRKELASPGGISISDVHAWIKCDEDIGAIESISLSGKVPSGLFYAMFDYGCWQKGAATMKALAFDGWFVTLYSIELARSHTTLLADVKKPVPSSWDPAALAEYSVVAYLESWTLRWLSFKRARNVLFQVLDFFIQLHTIITLTKGCKSRCRVPCLSLKEQMVKKRGGDLNYY